MTNAKILVVEDESIVAKDIAETLKSQGYDVPAIALSGEQAIEKAEQTRPDLVLMDIVLKGDMDGIAAAEQIRDRFSIPVVYLTAYADSEVIERARITEPFGYIIKPFEARELHTNIEMALYKHKAEEAYRTLVDHSLQGLAIFQDGRVAFANQAMAQITGYPVDEMLALPPEKVQAFVHPDDRELVWNRHRDRLNGEELPERYELRGIHKDGSICWLELDASRIEYQGKPAIQAAYVDVTERKKAEDARAKSERELKIRDRINNIFLTVPDEKMYTEVLNLVLEVMESEFGTFGYFNEDGAFVVPAMTRNIFWEKCNVPEKDIIFERGTFSGIWAKAIEEEKTLYSNEGPFHTPKGHITITNTMVTPIIYHDKVISAIHIANKSGSYNETDQAMLETLASKIAPVLYARLQADKQDKERKIAEESLRKREELHELFFSQSLDGFFFMMFDEPVRWDDTVDKEKVMDHVFAHQKITKINDAMLQQYGASRDQFIGMTPNDLYEHNIDHGREFWTRFFDAGQLHTETRERKLDGTPIWIEGDYTCLYDSQGRITGHFGVQREITDEKRAKEVLRENEAKYRTLFESMAQGAFYQRADGVLVDCNPAVLEMFGLTRDQFLGSTSMDPRWKAIHEDGSDFSGEQHPSMEALRTGEPVRSVVAGVFNPGKEEYVWLSINAIPQFKPGQDKPYQVFVTLHDITERKKAEEKIRQTKESYDRLTDNANEAIFRVKAGGGYVTYLNTAAERMFGYSKAEWAEDPSLGSKIIHPDFKEKQREIIDELNTTKETIKNTILKWIAKDGHEVIVEYTIVPIIDNSGKVIYFESIGRDITERIMATEALQESEENYHSIFDTANDAIFIHDAKTGAILDVNRKMCEMYGYTPEEVRKVNVEALSSGKSPYTLKHALGKITKATEGEPQLFEWHAKDKAGKLFWVEVNLKLATIGGHERLLAIVRDITERKKADKVLRESQYDLLKSQEIAHLGHWKLAPKT